MPTTDWEVMLSAVHNGRRGEVAHQGQMGIKCPERAQEAKAWSVKPLKARMRLGRMKLEPDLNGMPERDQVLGQV